MPGEDRPASDRAEEDAPAIDPLRSGRPPAAGRAAADPTGESHAAAIASIASAVAGNARQGGEGASEVRDE